VPEITPQEALEQFERTTGFRIHAATDADGTVWWRQPSEQPMFECTIGDRCMHIDELSVAKPYGPGNPQCPVQDSTGLNCAGPAGHGEGHANIDGTWTESGS
jgi:hypothetical protein